MERGELKREVFMQEIAKMTEHIVGQAKAHESDTVPGDFGELRTPCPKCGGVIKENYKKFQCTKCDFWMWKIIAGRQFENEEAETLLSTRTVGPLQGFRSQKGFPFAAVVKMSPEFKVEFDFGNGDTKNADGTTNSAPVDFSGKEPVGKCPKCGSSVFENGMNFVCEKSVGPDKKCDFRTGAVILQQSVDREQVAKLLTTGKTDLLKKFVSKKTGRNFEAYLVLKDGKVSFEFEPRKAGAKSKGKSSGPKEPQVKLDFTGQEPIGKCPRCGGKVFESPTDYVCEKSQAETKPCKFKTGKVVLLQPVDREQVRLLLEKGSTDVLTGFVSRKTGRKFSASLVWEDGKVNFAFAPREGE
jgi:DNA topoisomerase-3